MSSICIAKAIHIFAAKNVNVFENNLATTVNEFVINKLVKLTILCTTGPWFSIQTHAFDCKNLYITILITMTENNNLTSEYNAANRKYGADQLASDLDLHCVIKYVNLYQQPVSSYLLG